VFAHGSSVHQRCPNYALTNLSFGLCKSMRVIELLVNISSPHHRISTCPSTPKVLRAENAPQLFFLSLFSSLDLQLGPSRSLGVRHHGKSRSPRSALDLQLGPSRSLGVHHHGKSRSPKELVAGPKCKS